jgi:nucleoid-associated protein YgaU
MGNLEKILVGIIIVTIVAILGLAIWGLGGHEDGKHPSTASPSAAAPTPTTISPEKEPIPDAVGRSQSPAVTEIPSSPSASSSEVSKIANGFGDLVNASGTAAPSSGAPSFTSSSTPAADPPASSPATAKHVDPYPTFAERAPKYDVKKGDTYEKIARTVLGDSKRWKEIQSLNADVPPSKLHPGMQLVVPDATASSRTAAAPKTTPKESAIAKESASSTAKTSGSTHTVKKGETLYGIAREYLHDGNKWKLIAQANPDKIRGSSDIVVGSTLRIPSN